MASKGQKYNGYSSELKKEILNKYYGGESGPSLLSKDYNISVKTIWNWVYKTNTGRDVIEDHRPGHSGSHKKVNLTLEDYKEQCEILKKYRAFIEARRGKK